MKTARKAGDQLPSMTGSRVNPSNANFRNPLDVFTAPTALSPKPHHALSSMRQIIRKGFVESVHLVLRRRCNCGHSPTSLATGVPSCRLLRRVLKLGALSRSTVNESTNYNIHILQCSSTVKLSCRDNVLKDALFNDRRHKSASSFARYFPSRQYHRVGSQLTS